MIARVISGGQTGADQAGLRAAKLAGIPTGGWAPLGWKTEDGPAPWLADYGLVETPGDDYRVRTEWNARDSAATVWLGSTDSAGFKTTSMACRGIGRPMLVVRPGHGVKPSDVVAWVRERRAKVVNVAGNRESEAPGIGGRTERFLSAVFRASGESADPPPRALPWTDEATSEPF